jgi:hypothetical protein
MTRKTQERTCFTQTASLNGPQIGHPEVIGTAHHGFAFKTDRFQSMRYQILATAIGRRY